MSDITNAGAGAAVGLVSSLLGSDRSVRKSLLSALVGAGAGYGVGKLQPAAKTEHAAPPATADDKRLDPMTSAAWGLLSPIGSAAHAYTKGGLGAAGEVALPAVMASAPVALAGHLASAKLSPKQKAVTSLATILASAAGSAYGANEHNKKAATLDSLIPEERGVTGALADLASAPSSRRLAGRATGLAEAYDVDAGLAVTNPSSTRFLASLLGGLTGGGVGAVIADATHPEKGIRGQIGGASVGAAVGGLLSHIAHAATRRREIARVKKEIQAKLAEGATPQPVYNDSGPVAGLVNGAHQLGRADVAEALSFGRSKFDRNTTSSALELAASIPLLGSLLLPVTAANSAVDAQIARTRLDKAMPAADIKSQYEQ